MDNHTRNNIFSIIKSHVQIMHVVSEYTSLKRAGSYYKGICPLRSERTASFTVTPHKEIFYCFGCKTGGDVINFISSVEQCSPLAAARIIVERYNIQLPTECHSFVHEEKISAYQRHIKLCTLIATWCSEQLEHTPQAMAYLTSRNIDQTSIASFKIGLLPSGDIPRRNLLRTLSREGFLLDDMVSIKFMMAGKHGPYSAFEDRIIFPISDYLGNICGFGGRIFLPRDERPKYYNSHDHAHFSKGSLLFGLHQAKRSLQATDTAFLVEGYTDCIALHQSGTRNVVATLGTACTSEHLSLIGRYIHSVIVLYDSDRAGKEACLRLSELCWNHNLDLSFMTLPAGLDPALYLQQGHTINQLSPQDIFSWYLSSAVDSFSNLRLAEKLHHIRDLLAMIARVRDPLKINLLLQQAAQTWHLSDKLLAHELARLTQQFERSPTQPITIKQLAQHKSQKEISTFAKQAICAILNHRDHIKREDIDIVLRVVPEPYQIILRKLQDYKFSMTAPYQFSDFFATLSPEEQSLALTILHATPLGTTEISVGALFQRIKQRVWREDLRNLQSEIRKAQDHDPELVEEAMRKFERLKIMMHEEGIL